MNLTHLNSMIKDQVQGKHEHRQRSGLFETMICLVVCILFFSTTIDVKADVGKGAASGAAIGGFLGLVFGGDLGDVVEGAAIGAGAGAIGGAVSGSMKKKEAEKRTQQQREQEQRRNQKEQKQSQQQQAAKSQPAAKGPQYDEQALIRAIGEDNYRGLVALVDCEHKRAEALAKAGSASSNPDHRLSSIWLEALIASDLRQKERTAELYQQLVSADGDIDTPQQASIETDKVLMDVRQERRAKGISCKP